MEGSVAEFVESLGDQVGQLGVPDANWSSFVSSYQAQGLPDPNTNEQVWAELCLVDNTDPFEYLGH
jgi:transposase